MRIVSDTSTLYSVKEGKDIGVTIVPAYIIHEDKSYRDYEDITSEEFFKVGKKWGCV